MINEFMVSDYSRAKNATENLLLTWNTREETGTPVLHFAVWDLISGEQVYSGTAVRGKVSWMSPTSLELYDYPGIIDDNNPLYKYKIDLKSKTKTALREENKL